MSNEVATISREELREMIEDGDEFVLVDTLDGQFYEHSHLPGAISIPLEEIERAEDRIPDKNTDVIVYCMSPI
ncbi:hypothetical protein BH24ACT22_BH24ACT22_20330 [soil metagenome]